MLEVEDLHVSYGKVNAVRGISMSAHPGKITLVLGANGAGKTTSMNAIAGLLKPDSGRVELQGRSIAGTPPHKIVRLGMALVPEGRRIFGPLTVAENLRMGAYTTRSGFDETLARVHEMFPILKERAGSPAGLLSGGEQQMLAFGRAPHVPAEGDAARRAVDGPGARGGRLDPRQGPRHGRLRHRHLDGRAERRGRDGDR
ncbi:ATP-binding cassette domain-containing protein [Nocardioides sp. TF02-7]|uniref:ABC transporter ATP-binding protein n=1 Tax=Nocardioides sp. TF02-7 TaxID=2917724 RepID=UPI001F0534BE|nr:ATP-binding cassette domain-containing protein [Nocardioides sp. TF02-7]UMG91213.1 ATP-binding cassette domain-containing protein [Nocardioides sp. TF02-7]